MAVFEGRSIFVVDLPQLANRIAAAELARTLSRAHCSGLWIRIGRGRQVQRGLTERIVQDLKSHLTGEGIRLCGWHVPFCADDAETAAEVALVDGWATTFNLDGVIADAERTRESPRFRGEARQARDYIAGLSTALGRRGVELGFSSHDQPDLHRDLPFHEFLLPGQPVMPQVYNHDADPRPRLHKSEKGYEPFLGVGFYERYMPTANASMVGDVAFPDEATCLRSLDRFLDHVEAKGYRGHSFWCWEEVPTGFWPALEARPVREGT